MRQDEAIRRIAEHRAELADFAVCSLSLFGSAARDTSGPASDVDVLVTFEHAPTLVQFMNLKFALEEWLGCPVDLVDRKALRPGWRELVEQESVLVA